MTAAEIVAIAFAFVALAGVGWPVVSRLVHGMRGGTPRVELPAGERVLASLPAAHWVGLAARDGRLFLTDAGLRFTPRRFAGAPAPLFLPWAALRDVRPVADGAAGGVELVTADGAYVFVVATHVRSLDRLLRVAESPREDRAALVARLGLDPESPERTVLTA